MAKKTQAVKKYLAVVGIDFENLKPAVRVEAGDPIPDRVSASDLKDLLEMDLIRVEGSENE